MASQSNILDGLAWAGLSEPARVARISAVLVRMLSSRKTHTKKVVADYVRSTSPPYGRAKHVVAAVEVEYRRQLPIYRERQKKQMAWQDYLNHMAMRETRINHAYAHAFGRPPLSPSRSCPIPYTYDPCNYDERVAWQEAERARDKGDMAVAVTHQNGYTVCLVQSEQGRTAWHIATRQTKGPIVRTYLRCNQSDSRSCPDNLVSAAMSLGGPAARAAAAKGKRVVTDWAGRRTFIHHEGQDHHAAGIEELPWRAVVRVGQANYWEDPWRRVMVHGESVVEDPTKVNPWNDID